MSSMGNQNVRWLECLLNKGMFSDEVAVTYPASEDYRKSVFVPKSYVRGDVNSKGFVQVVVMKQDNKLWAILPSSQKDIVEVTEKDFKE